jgi:membrane-bound serine protease (ClpP class)
VVNESIFQIMWRPEVMIILILMAFYGLIGMLSSPGAILVGLIGATAMVVALHKVTILPVDTTGSLLFALAVALFAIDVFALAHGMLTGGGARGVSDRWAPVFRSQRPTLSPLAWLHH